MSRQKEEKKQKELKKKNEDDNVLGQRVERVEFGGNDEAVQNTTHTLPRYKQFQPKLNHPTRVTYTSLPSHDTYHNIIFRLITVIYINYLAFSKFNSHIFIIFFVFISIFK